MSEINLRYKQLEKTLNTIIPLVTKIKDDLRTTWLECDNGDLNDDIESCVELNRKLENKLRKLSKNIPTN